MNETKNLSTTTILNHDIEVVTADTVETTTFSHDLAPTIVETVERVSMEDNFSDSLTNDLSSILERPYYVSNFEWNSSTPAGKEIHSCYPLSDYLAQPNVGMKLKGFAFGTFDLRMRFRATFQRFHTGKLLISAIPGGRYSYGYQPDRVNLVQESTAHHVEIDAGSREEVILDLPFYSARSAYLLDAIKALERWELTVRVLNPLTGSTNSEKVTISCFVEATKIDLQFPTAQSAEGVAKTKQGIISSTAAVVKDVANALTAVPVLSSIAGPVSWVASGVEALASAFGFSKPMNLGNNSRVTQVPSWGYTNVDGEDNSVSLSYSLGNEISQLPEHDDMDINTIASRQGLLATHKWSSSDTVGKVIAAIPVGCRNYYEHNRDTAGTERIRVHMPVSLLSTLFLFWRGTMRYRFSFAKNTFYSGKVVVSYKPFANSAPTLAAANMLYKQELSLRDSSEFIFDLPYASNLPWFGVNDSTGILTVSVSNPLQTVDNVADSIEMNVWVSSPDMKFACATRQLGRFYRMAAHQTVRAPFAPLPHEYVSDDETLASSRVAQGIVPEKGEGVVAPAVPLYKTKPLARPVTTMGEEIVNLRPLMRRFNFFSSPDTDICYAPIPRPVSEGPLSATAPTSPASILDFFSLFYRFWRGGLRVKVWAPEPVRYITAAGIDGYANATPYMPVDENPLLLGEPTNCFSHIVDTRETPSMEVRLPYYGNTERKFTGNLGSYEQFGQTTRTLIGTADDALAPTSTRSLHFIASDDCATFSMFMYCPVEIVTTV